MALLGWEVSEDRKNGICWEKMFLLRKGGEGWGFWDSHYPKALFGSVGLFPQRLLVDLGTPLVAVPHREPIF